jgi:hypothetical protein
MSIRSYWGPALGVVLTSALRAALFGSCGEGGGGSEAFCEIAETSARGRNEAEIDQYYQELEAAAPGEIKEDIRTLRQGWNQFSFPLEQHLEGEITDISRPPEVTEAALNVFDFVEENCGFQGGVYLIYPEAGF